MVIILTSHVGIPAGVDEGRDLEVLLDPLEEDLYSPALLVRASAVALPLRAKGRFR
jgi:hypothetical protein